MNQPIELINVAIVGFRYISERTTIPVPRLFGYGFNNDNPTGCPFMIMDSLPLPLLERITYAEIYAEFGKIAHSE
jgi:hypothetical protein